MSQFVILRNHLLLGRLMQRTSHSDRQALPPLAAALAGTAQATPLGPRETMRPSLPPATRLQIANRVTLTIRQSALNTRRYGELFFAE